MLISGGQQGLDIADMRAHVQYSGGYHEVRGGWSVVNVLGAEK